MSERLVKVDEIEDSETEEQLKQLRKFIDESGALNKAILIMSLDGISHAEISEAIGISLNNVGTKIARIKKSIETIYFFYLLVQWSFWAWWHHMPYILQWRTLKIGTLFFLVE